ncbi:MAG: P63C domain-containing protein [Pseudolabrys sp.]|nr:P63C domain-containing protein [Pseudolabrys sp.]
MLAKFGCKHILALSDASMGIVMLPDDDSKEVPARAAGGNARAAALSKEERKEIARRGAVARWNKGIPKAEHTGTLEIADLEIDCAVLSDGRRVLSQRSVNRALGRTHGGADFRRRQSEAGGGLPIFLVGKALQPFISDDLRAVVSKPILYDVADGNPVLGLGHGIEADALPLVCEVWVKANEAGVLRPNQVPTAIRAGILLRGLQKIGITALVDEATGYQDVRPKDELRLILQAYISKELLPWTERFPEEFYKEMFRLRDWPFSSLQYDKKGPQGPRYAAKLTTELVYNQLPPGVRQELERLNPKSENGRRKYHHHRFLSGEIGHTHLEKQVAVVTALMRISPDWDAFMKNFNRNFRPHLPVQRDLFDDIAAQEKKEAAN